MGLPAYGAGRPARPGTCAPELAVKELIAFSPCEAGLLVLGLCLLLGVWLPVTLLRRYVTLPFIPILGAWRCSGSCRTR